MLTQRPVGRRRARPVVAPPGLRRRARGSWSLLSPPPHLPTSDSQGARLTSASHTHLRTDTQTLVFQLADTFVLSSVRVRACARAAAKQSRLSVARGLWRQICLNGFIVSRGGRDAERETQRRAEGDLALRGGPPHARERQLVPVRLLWACCADLTSYI